MLIRENHKTNTLLSMKRMLSMLCVEKKVLFKSFKELRILPAKDDMLHIGNLSKLTFPILFFLSLSSHTKAVHERIH